MAILKKIIFTTPFLLVTTGTFATPRKDLSPFLLKHHLLFLDCFCLPGFTSFRFDFLKDTCENVIMVGAWWK
jgi:hypothetical protein